MVIETIILLIRLVKFSSIEWTKNQTGFYINPDIKPKDPKNEGIWFIASKDPL